MGEGDGEMTFQNKHMHSIMNGQSIQYNTGSPRSSYKVSPDWRPPLRFNKRTNNRNNGP